MFVDSHCHLDRLNLSQYSTGIEGALLAARTAGVSHFLNVCIHPDTFPKLLLIASNQEDISVSVGLHPTESILTEPSVAEFVALASHPKVVALGETGLDYYRATDNHSYQKVRFRRHIQAAKKVGKPLIVHTRKACADTLALLEEEGAARVGGVLHCFTESLEMAIAAIENYEFYISFSGVLTFKNASDLREIARKLPLDRILIETDSPYLAPVPFRGKPNQPAYVRYVAETLAVVHGISLGRVAQETTDNFFRLFQKAKPSIFPTT